MAITNRNELNPDGSRNLDRSTMRLLAIIAALLLAAAIGYGFYYYMYRADPMNYSAYGTTTLVPSTNSPAPTTGTSGNYGTTNSGSEVAPQQQGSSYNFAPNQDRTTPGTTTDQMPVSPDMARGQ